MEEIDIIELLKRVKEGKAPKKIEIDETEYIFYQSLPDITECYRDNEHNSYMSMETITLDTKIKILDKPIIEELAENDKIKDLIETIAKLQKENEKLKAINSIRKELEKILGDKEIN